MASLDHTVNIIFGADDSGFNSTINDVSGSLKGFSADIGKIAAPVADVVTALLKIEAAAAVAGVALLILANDAAGDFKDGMKELGALFNANADQVDDLSERLLKFGETSVSSYADIQKAAFQAISAGADQATITDTLAKAQELAVAGSTSLETATSALTGTMNAYGATVEDTTKFSDLLFLAAQQGKTNLTDMGNAIGKVATTAKNSGVSMEELASSIVAVTIAGISTDETMTTLKALFTELASPSDKLKKAMGGLTIESDGLQAVLAQLKKETGGTQQGFDAIFGSSLATTGALILANDATGKFNNTLEMTKTSTGLVTENFKKMAEGNLNLGNIIKETLIKLGKPLDDSFDAVRNGIARIFLAFGDGVKTGGIGQLETFVIETATKLAANLEGIAKALPDALLKIDFSEFIKQIEGVGGELEKIFNDIFGEGLDLTKPEDLARALQTAVDIASQLVKFTKEVVKELEPLLKGFSQIATDSSTASDNTIANLAKIAANMLLIDSAGVGVGSALIGVKAVGADIAFAFTFITESISITLGVVRMLEIAILDLGIGVTIMGSKFFDAFIAIWESFVNLFEDIPLIIETVTNDVSEFLLGLINGIVNTFDKLAKLTIDIPALSSFFTGLKEKAEKAGIETLNNVEGLKNKLSNITLVIPKVQNFLKEQRTESAENVEALKGIHKTLVLDYQKTAGDIAISANNIAAATSRAFGDGAINTQKQADEFIAVINEFARQFKEESAKFELDSFDLSMNAIDFKWPKPDTTDVKNAIEDVGKTAEKTNKKFLFSGDQIKEFDKQVAELRKSHTLFASDWDYENNKGTITLLDKFGEKSKEAADSVTKITTETQKLTEAQKLSIDNSFKLQESLLKLSSDERIKGMEFNVNFKIAEVQANAERIKGMFASLGESVTATAAATSSMFGTLADSLTSGFISSANEDFIKSQYADQAGRQQQALNLQSKATDVELALNIEKLKQLQKGGGDIIVKGDNLAPELQALMESFVRNVRLEATKEGLGVLA